MKLSTETLAILKNFTQINPSIILKRGSMINTCTMNKVIYAETNISDVIDYDLAITDLNSFLQMVALAGSDAEIFLNESDNNITIKNNNVTMSYPNGSVTQIVSPSKSLELKTADVVFELKSEQLDQITKACRMMQLKVVSIMNKDGKLYVSATNPQNASSEFTLEIGTCDYDKTFNYDIHIDNFRFISSNYSVSCLMIKDNFGCAEFKSDNTRYVVSFEKTSKQS